MFQNLNLKHFYLFFFINKVVNYQIYHIQKYRVVLMGKLSTIQPPLCLCKTAPNSFCPRRYQSFKMTVVIVKLATSFTYAFSYLYYKQILEIDVCVTRICTRNEKSLNPLFTTVFCKLSNVYSLYNFLFCICACEYR